MFNMTYLIAVKFLVSYGADPDFKFDDFITLKEICADNGVEIKEKKRNSLDKTAVL